MTPARHHAEWLSLVESSGPFLSMPVLLRVFPQGLDLRDATRAAALRENYEDWLERGRPLLHVHTAWIRHVLENLLEWPAEFIAEGQSIPAGMEASQSHFGETLRPDLVLRRPPGTADADTTPQLLVVTYSTESLRHADSSKSSGPRVFPQRIATDLFYGGLCRCRYRSKWRIGHPDFWKDSEKR